MRTINGYSNDPDKEQRELCLSCGQPCFVTGIWHENKFRIIPPDVDVHDPHFEAFYARQCCNCGRVDVSLHVVGPLTTA